MCVPILPDTDSPATPFTSPVPSCPEGEATDGAGGCIPKTVKESCAVGYVSDGDGNCISIPVPVANIPSSSPSACPC